MYLGSEKAKNHWITLGEEFPKTDSGRDFDESKTDMMDCAYLNLIIPSGDGTEAPEGQDWYDVG